MISGNFVVHKTTKAFSALGLDHAHEQNNAHIKASGGAVGLTQDPSSLRRWTIGGPEICRVLHEFEEPLIETSSSECHHEAYNSFQKNFAAKCVALKEAFLRFENPFTVEEDELMCLVTRIEVEEEGRDAVNSLEEKGVKLYKDFIQERLFCQTKSLYDPIPKQLTKIFIPRKKSCAGSSNLK